MFKTQPDFLDRRIYQYHGKPTTRRLIMKNISDHFLPRVDSEQMTATEYATLTANVQKCLEDGADAYRTDDGGVVMCPYRGEIVIISGNGEMTTKYIVPWTQAPRGEMTQKTIMDYFDRQEDSDEEGGSPPYIFSQMSSLPCSMEPLDPA